MKQNILNQNEVYVIKQGFLGGWFCVDERLSEDEALEKIYKILKSGNTILEPPVEDKELIRDRLFGGFPCEEDENRRHVYFALDCYSFTNPINKPLTDEQRKKVWEELNSNNNQILGGKNFTKGLNEIL